MRILQQERQAVFQDAFQSDLKYYKEVGKIPSQSNDLESHFCLIFEFFLFLDFSYIRLEIEIENKAVQQTLSLEEIVLDNETEKKEFDKFLEE